YLILSHRLPLINQEANRILADVCDFTIEFFNNEEDKKIELFIIDKSGIKIDLCLASGAEKTMASLAILTSLWNICCLPKCSTLFLDEPFGYMDNENKENIVSLLNSIKNYFKNI